MPADAVNYGKLAEELNGLLAGGRIDKIVMGAKRTIMRWRLTLERNNFCPCEILFIAV